MAPNFGPIKDPGPVPPLLRPGKGITPASEQDSEAGAGRHAGASETAASPTPPPDPRHGGEAGQPSVPVSGDENAATGGDQQAEGGDSAERQLDASEVVRIETTHRKAPRYGRFIVTGLLLGAIISFLIAIISRGWSGLTMANTFWLSLIGLGTLGMFIGAAVALVLDRKSLQAMRQAQKES